MSCRFVRRSWAVALISSCAGPSSLGAWAPPFWSMQRLGLFGPDFVATTGEHITRVNFRDVEGHVAGESSKYSGGGGVATWTWSKPAGTVRTGLLQGSEFTRTDGWQRSSNSALHESGRTSGISYRYVGSIEAGWATWVWDPMLGTIRTGLFTGSEFTRADGYKRSTNSQNPFNFEGRIVGQSERFNGTSTDLGAACWTWDAQVGTQRIGLFAGTEFTASDGTQYSEGWLQYGSDMIFGMSELYNGKPPSILTPDALWAWAPAMETRRIGLLDPEFTGTNGDQHSAFTGGTTLNWAIGSSTRYSSGSGSGAWVWNPEMGTARIGLFGSAEFMRSNGYQMDRARFITEGNRVVGQTERFNGGSVLMGEASWMWHPETGTRRIGLYEGPEYLRADNYQYSDAIVYESGNVGGVSGRYHGMNSAGAAAWIWTPSNGTVRVGLFDSPEYTGQGDYQSSVSVFSNHRETWVGYSIRYEQGLLELGKASWVWTPATGTVRTGLTDGTEFTRSDGTQVSNTLLLNQQDRVTGISNRYSGTVPTGNATWTWSVEAGTSRTGLFEGVEFTRNDGFQSSETEALTEPGFVVGKSSRYSGTANDLGYATWTWSSEYGTMRTGLVGGVHTRADGMQTSFNSKWNEAGYVAGKTNRWSASGSGIGRSGWVFSPVTQQTFPLIFSVAGDGRAETDIFQITNSGWVLGTYSRFQPSGGVATRAYIWHETHGFSDLGELVSGGLAAYSCDFLNAVIGVDDQEWVLASGRALGGGSSSQAVYLLSAPTCPGDANSDNRTDGRDLSILLSLYQHKVPVGSAVDFNTDGLINGADLSILLGHFGCLN